MIIENEIRQQITISLDTSFLELVNESHMHNVPTGSESHFKLTLASDAFTGKRLVQRHQFVYKVLEQQMPKIHALALHLYTDEEWLQKEKSPSSPQCMGGE